MVRFNLYRQERVDGGVRTGLSVEGAIELQTFVAGSEDEEDPALLWFVDLRGSAPCDGESSEAVRVWLAENSTDFRGGLRELADQFRAGIDVQTWPIRGEFPRAPSGSAVEYVLSATRRLDAIAIGEKLSAMAEEWDDLLNRLQPPVEAS